jgi:cobalt/nickel transport system permease protein
VHLIDYCANTNRWHDRHPGEKLLLAGGMLALSLILPPVPGCVFILAVMLPATLVGARVPPRIYLRVCAIPLGFLLAGAVSLMVSVRWGAPGGLHLIITHEAVVTAARVTLRSVAAISCLFFLALTTPMAELLILLRRLGLPVAVADLMSLTYRFLFLFTETLHTMTLAQASRLGYGTLRQTYRSLALLTVSFFGRVLDRVRRLETGLAARGYQGELRILSVPRRLGRIAVAGIMALELLVVVATICVSAR